MCSESPVQTDQQSYSIAWNAISAACRQMGHSREVSDATRESSGTSGVLPRFGITHELQLRCAAAQRRIVLEWLSSTAQILDHVFAPATRGDLCGSSGAGSVLNVP
jgi:hypothetical protein